MPPPDAKGNVAVAAPKYMRMVITIMSLASAIGGGAVGALGATWSLASTRALELEQARQMHVTIEDHTQLLATLTREREDQRVLLRELQTDVTWLRRNAERK